jgi:hypothetical protein
MHRSLLFTISLSLFAITMPATSDELNQHEIYFNHLEYEYGNRARTYIGMEVAAKASRDSDRGPFFQAYYEMEVLNREIYGHMKEELDVDYQVNWFVGMGLKATGYLGWRFLDAQWFVDIVIPYLPKLEEMRSLSDPQHRLFFDYVVAQEEVQLAASQAVVDGNWQDGADLIQAFLPQARTVLVQLTQSPD